MSYEQKETSQDDEDDDYLEQLQWQSSFRRNWPARFRPKWKYRIEYENEGPTIGNRILRWLIVILLVGGLFLAFTDSTSQGEYGLPIAIGVIILLVVIFMLFAVRDAENVNDNDEEDYE